MGVVVVVRSAARRSKGKATLMTICRHTLLTKIVQLHAVSSLSICVISVQSHSVNQVS